MSKNPEMETQEQAAEEGGHALYEAVARRAYEISRSGEGGTDEENWLRAEAEMRNELAESPQAG
jgi:hypothetical protein